MLKTNDMREKKLEFVAAFFMEMYENEQIKPGQQQRRRCRQIAPALTVSRNDAVDAKSINVKQSSQSSNNHVQYEREREGAGGRLRDQQHWAPKTKHYTRTTMEEFKRKNSQTKGELNKSGIPRNTCILTRYVGSIRRTYSFFI